MLPEEANWHNWLKQTLKIESYKLKSSSYLFLSKDKNILLKDKKNGLIFTDK